MSAVYTYSEARQKLATILDEADREGEVRVRRRDGRVFVIRPERGVESPLDVPGIDLDMPAEEIVGFIHEGRRIYLDPRS
jgi:hypothetical protein